MALAVREKIVNILMKFGQMSQAEGQSMVQQMRRTGRLTEEYFG